MRKIFMGAVFMLLCELLPAQNCKVGLDSLDGTYEGECRSGKANGNGTAKGIHSYTGSFKNGLPDGKGKYTWQNGDWFEGEFKKGLKEGPGIMHSVHRVAVDSLLKGFWKNDKYSGKYEKPYKVFSRSPGIIDLDVNSGNSNMSEITINTLTTSGGANSGDGLHLKQNWGITGVDLLEEGRYQFKSYSQTPGSATDILFNVEYPLKVRINFGTESIEIEFYEKREWKLRISIHE